MVRLNLTLFSVTSFSIACIFDRNTEAEFAAHLAIGWQLYKLHTLRLRYGCGIWRYTRTIIPHEPGSKNCSTVRSRHEMAHPTRKCYRFRDKPRECFIGTLRSPVQTAARVLRSVRGSQKKIEALARLFARSFATRGRNELSFPVAKMRQFFPTFRPCRVQPLKNTRLRRTNYFRWLFNFYSGL